MAHVTWHQASHALTTTRSSTMWQDTLLSYGIPPAVIHAIELAGIILSAATTSSFFVGLRKAMNDELAKRQKHDTPIS